MRAVARIITRMTSKNDGLFLGVTLKGGSSFFKPNSVYELRESMGEVLLVKVGDADVNWGMDISDIVQQGGGSFLTREEFLTLKEQKLEREDL